VKVSNNKGIANHIGPESCAGRSNSVGEALTGEQVGWVLSHEKGEQLPCADHVRVWEGNTARAQTQAKGRHGAVGDPKHAWRHSERESGEPVSAQREDGRMGCIGKSEDASQ
jgi:hypothetical protein